MGSEGLIIGGGVLGLSIARSLHKTGVRNITVLDRSAAGREASWAAAGMLGPQAETDEAGAFFDLCSTSRDLYPEFAGALLDETGIDIELDRTGTLYLAFGEKDADELDNRYRWQQEAGLAVERLTRDEILAMERHVSPRVVSGLLFPNDWQVENRKLLSALERYAELNGIEIREGVEVESVVIDEGRATGVRTGGETIAAGSVILATGAWTSLIKLGAAGMPFEVAPVRGQIVAYQGDERLFDHVIYSHRGYVVPRRDGRILAGSTTEHAGFEKAVTESAAEGLSEMAAEILPKLADMRVADQWAGLRPFAGDGLPVIGSIPGIDALTVATAHYRNGILLAPVTAEMVAKTIGGGVEDAHLEEFSPTRFVTRRVGTSV